MNGSEARRDRSATTVLDIAELVLEVPQAPRSRANRREAPRRRDSELVPDHGKGGELVPDCWGGVDLV